MHNHRKALSFVIDEMLFDGRTGEQRAALEAQDEETWRSVELDSTEWLLAEDQVLVKGEPVRVADVFSIQAGGRSPAVSAIGSHSWPNGP